MNKTSLLLEEVPLMVQPGLACAIGINNAIVVQQIKFLLKMPKGGRKIHGEKYVWNTYEGWQQEHFPWWSVDTLQRIFTDLEKLGILGSCQPDGHMSRKKYYRLMPGADNYLTYERLEELKSDHGKLRSSKDRKLRSSDHGKLPSSDHGKLPSSLTETTTKNTTDINTRQRKGTKVPVLRSTEIKPKGNESSKDDDGLEITPIAPPPSLTLEEHEMLRVANERIMEHRRRAGITTNNDW